MGGTRFILLGCVLSALCVALFIGPATIVGAYELASFRLFPSAEKGLRYGSRHLDSHYPYLYDIGIAEYFFKQASRVNPNFPYLNHQRARVAFLKGNFSPALSLISKEIELQRDNAPKAYYVRGLIRGYMGRHEEAARDYEKYLETDANNWAAVNDYAWVLLKAGRSSDALSAVEKVLPYWQENAWLLNSAAIAAHEVGDSEKALAYVERADQAAQTVTREEWLVAYPGNDPRIADQGIAALKNSIRDNMHTIAARVADGAIQ